MSDEYSFRRNNIEKTFFFKYYFTLASRRLVFIIIIILLIIFLWLNSISSSENSNFKFSKNIPTLARNLYLFICENQAEVNSYSQILPSIAADVIFYCWNENCNSWHFRSPLYLFINKWSSQTKRTEKLISFQSIETFYPIKSRIFFINEKQLGLKEKLTWTTARNKLYEFALNEETKQRWRWSYYIFADGDIHTACPLAEQLLTNRSTVDYGKNEEYLFASHFYSFINLTNSVLDEEKCFLLFDAFLLSISPAIATITGASGPMAYPGLLTQIVYHVDAMFNAIHRDALTFLLPYCPRYDGRSWWTSQAILVYRSLCLYGHTLSFDGIHIVQQIHRVYPRIGDPWIVDNDMNLVPHHLLRLKDYMKRSHFVSPLVLHHYSGWNLQLTSETCRNNHTAIKLDTCLVYGNNINEKQNERKV